MAEPRVLILDLAPGEVGEVPLERYGTAGYVWQIGPVPPGLSEVGILPRPGGGGAPGAPTLETLRLRAAARGEHALVLTLRRPWEAAPLRELAITVRVR